MKTSVIEVRDMLSVLSVAAVETRIGKVGGVESVTVNYAAGNATVRYDETRLDIADIKADVRQSGYDEDGPTPVGSAHGPATQAAPSEGPGATPKTPPGANDAVGAATSGSPPPDPSAPGAEPSAPANFFTGFRGGHGRRGSPGGRCRYRSRRGTARRRVEAKAAPTLS